jgi:DNA-binding response OmpR family regulator
MNILLIEDDEMLLKVLTYQLMGKGHRVYPANNGRKAVDIALDHSIDLVICDLMVPIISGVTFLRLRKKYMRDDIPVIAMSILDDAEETLHNLGVDYGYFIRKPIDFEKLSELIVQCQVKIEAVRNMDVLKIIPPDPSDGGYTKIDPLQ